MNDLTTTNNPLAKGYLITPQQFIDEDYAAGIERGEYEVFYYCEAPTEDARESEKLHYNLMLQNSGNVIPVVRVSDQGSGYYFLYTNRSTMGCSNEQKLLVWSKS